MKFSMNHKISDHELFSVQEVKSLGGRFACLCWGFEFKKVKKKCYHFSKRQWKYFYTYSLFYSK